MLTTPGMIASVTSTGTSTSPVSDQIRAWAPSSRPSRSASPGLTQSVQRSLPFTSGVRLCIQELFERSWRRPMSTMPPLRLRPMASRRRSTSATIGSGASSIIPVVVRSISGTRGSSSPRSTPWGESSSMASVSWTPSVREPKPSP